MWRSCSPRIAGPSSNGRTPDFGSGNGGSSPPGPIPTKKKRAGVPGRLLHDLRRSAARDYRRAGVSEGEIMQLCGWETRSMFDRYNIIDEADLARAVAKRFNERQATASDAPAPAHREPLSSDATI